MSRTQRCPVRLCPCQPRSTLRRLLVGELGSQRWTPLRVPSAALEKRRAGRLVTAGYLVGEKLYYALTSLTVRPIHMVDLNIVIVYHSLCYDMVTLKRDFQCKMLRYLHQNPVPWCTKHLAASSPASYVGDSACIHVSYRPRNNRRPSAMKKPFLL